MSPETAPELAPPREPRARRVTTPTEPVKPDRSVKGNTAEPADHLVSTSEMAAQRPIAKPPGVTAQSRVMWEYVVPVVLFHLTIPLAFFSYFFSWWGIAWLFVGNYLFTSLGIGAGYHRLLTHRGFKCPKWLEYTLTTLGVCSLQDSPARWVLVHRLHHQHSDHEHDPHTPMVSTFWSHVGWLFVDNADTSSGSNYDKYARDILKDPYYRWLQRGLNWLWVYAAHAVAITAVGYLIGLLWTGTWSGSVQVGLQFLLWGVILRTVFTWHVTWGINSFSHLWGYRKYETRENSRNNWLFAFLTNGEGWHNNHHADPRSARHGHSWWEIDITWMTLQVWERMGLVWDLVRPNRSALDRRAAGRAVDAPH